MARIRLYYDPETKTFSERAQQLKRDVDAPMVVQDSMDALQNFADGRIYESKSAFRAATKAAGLVEMGNDSDPRVKIKDHVDREAQLEGIEQAVWEAYYAARDNQAPISELTKETCKIIDHNNRNYNYDRRGFDDDGNPI